MTPSPQTLSPAELVLLPPEWRRMASRESRAGLVREIEEVRREGVPEDDDARVLQRK